MHCFNVEKLRVPISKTAIMQRESAQICSALWRTRVEISYEVNTISFVALYNLSVPKIIKFH